MEKPKNEFYIPRLSRETSLYGTEFEVRLRNEMIYSVQLRGEARSGSGQRRDSNRMLIVVNKSRKLITMGRSF